MTTLLGLPVLTFGQLTPPAPPVISDPSTLTAAYESLVGQWLAVVSPYAFEVFMALAGLDLALFGWTLWRTYHGDIHSALLSTANKLLIIGFFLALLMNGETWMADIINMFIDLGKAASGMPSLSPSVVLLAGFKIFGSMLWQAMKSGLLTDLPTAAALVLAAFVICACFLLITIQFVITKVQTFLALGMGYFFLAFGGSKWTTSYVERYFAYAVASGVKLMALYLLIGAGWAMSNSWIQQAQQAPFTLAGVEVAWAIMCGAVIYAGICWYGSAQVSQVLGGSPNLSHSDFVAFMGPMVSAAITSGMIAAGLASGGPAGGGAALGLTAAGVGASGAGSIGAQTFGSNPSGAPPPQASGSAVEVSSSSSSAGRIATGIAQIAQTGAAAIARMPHSGPHCSPPQFNGFHH